MRYATHLARARSTYARGADFALAPFHINRMNLDVVWFPKNVIPYGVAPRRVVTVLDLAYYLAELNAYRLMDTLYMKRMIKSSSKRADAIISKSDNTKNDLIRIFSIQPEMITTVHLGANEGYRPIDDDKALQKIRHKYQLPDQFLLFTGSITPRKNLSRLVEAFNRIEDKRGYHLVLTGNKLYKTDAELNLIRNSKNVKEIGFVDDEDMPLLYNLSDLFVYPSLYEGFGIPILEAQACGRPVISSSTSSLDRLIIRSVCANDFTVFTVSVRVEVCPCISR